MSPAEVATVRSKQHLKTAKRLAKLEFKRNRKLARKARRRRRRLLVVNFFLSLIRGVLGALVSAAIATVIATMVTEGQLDERPRVRGLIVVLTFVGFLWGMAYFPFPKPREILSR